MAKSSKRKPASSKKPIQSLSRTAQAKRNLIVDTPNKSAATIERQRQALEQAKLEQRMKEAYDRTYRQTMIAAAKQAARQDAAKAALKQSSPVRKDNGKRTRPA